MAEWYFDDKQQAMPTTPYLERLRHSIEASMPPECQACVLCGDDPTYIGAGMVDGIRIGYHLCEACYTPGWIARITTKVRGEMFLRRRN